MRKILYSVEWIVSKRLVTVINLILSAVIGYKTVWLVLTADEMPTHYFVPTTVSKISQAPSTQTLAYQLPTLLEANLLGSPATKSVPVPPQTGLAPPPQTSLSLKLQGVYYSTNPQASIALITHNKEENAKLYKLNASLPGGAVLHQIYPKKVILLRNARQETLLLVDNKSVDNKGDFKESTPPSSPTPINQNSQTARPEQLLGQYQQQLMTNPQSLKNLLNVMPASEEGKFVGYRLAPGTDPTLMTQFNLQSGDILTEVNGVMLDSPLKGLTIVQQLATANQVTLKVIRGGQPVSLSFEVEKQ